MRMTEVSIKRPVFITMVAMGLIVLGLLAVDKLGLDLFPNTSFGFVTVNTVYPGASPTEVERGVTDKIEEAVSSINGVDKITSTSRFSFSQVFIQFELDVDERAAADEVAEKVNAIRSRLPSDAEAPAVVRLDPTAIPIITFAARSERNASELRDYVDDIVRPALEKIDGVATVQIVGTTEREVHIDVDRDKLQRHRMTLTQLAQRLGSETLDVPAGTIETPERETGIKSAGRPTTLQDLERVVLMALPGGTGGVLHLGDVATVSMGLEDQRAQSRVNGAPGLTFHIQKRGGANTVEVSQAVGEAIAKLKLPPDIQIEKILDAADFIQINVDHLWEHLIVGGLAAILIIFLFMLDWRSTLISSFALPISIVATFFFMWQFGFTLNIMSMLGLTLAVGILIDDSVVVRENIFKHLEMGKPPKQAAFEGTKEIALAVLATTFTILAVFVPIAFTGGMVGKFFREFGLTVAVSVTISLFVSLTLDPMLSTKITQQIKPGHHEHQRRIPIIGHLHRFYDWMDRFYTDTLRWVMRHRVLTVVTSVGVSLGSCALIPMMGMDFAPRGDRGEFTVMVELPAGTSLAKSASVAEDVEQILMRHPEFKQVATTVGPNDEVEKIQMRVTFTKRTERAELLPEILEALRKDLDRIPGATYYMREAGLGDGSFDEAPITLWVTGPDSDELGRQAGRLLEQVKLTSGVRDASMTYKPGAIESRVYVDRERAADRGVSSQEIAMTLRMALEGAVVTKMVQGEDEIDVRLRLREEDAASVEALGKLNVAPIVIPGMPMGAQVELGQVTRVADAATPSTIKRMDRQRLVTITGNVYGRTLGEVIPDLQKALGALELPPGYGFRFGGEAERMNEANENMGLAFLLGLLFIYLVLASQFESFIHPLTIMTAMLFAAVGANVALFITGQSMSLPSMIGTILLMGLVTKNSILLVDYTIQLRDQGMSITDALMKAGPSRLRPILMTSAAIVLGMLPAAVSTGEGTEFYAPMSISVIGGVITSTLLTLVVVPIFYTWFDRLTFRGFKEWRTSVKKLKAAKRAAKQKGAQLPGLDAEVTAVRSATPLEET